jgi:hypothetical protein
MSHMKTNDIVASSLTNNRGGYHYHRGCFLRQARDKHFWYGRALVKQA